MRRLFIIRKDLHLSAGKLAAMVSHCAEAYWTNMIRNGKGLEHKKTEEYGGGSYYNVSFQVDGSIMNDYINGNILYHIAYKVLSVKKKGENEHGKNRSNRN